jgi:predicted transposase YbfD/YdcC
VTCSGCGRIGYEESKCWICHPALKKAAPNWKASTKQKKTQANVATAKNTWSEDELFLTREQNNEYASEDVIEKALLVSNSTDWILDSGASSHYCNDESQMRSYIPCRVPLPSMARLSGYIEPLQ